MAVKTNKAAIGSESSTDSKRTYRISVGESCFSKSWKQEEWTWAEIVKRCKENEKTKETLAAYQAMSGEEKLKAKDVGGFVGGPLKGIERNKEAVQGRTLITLDLDKLKDATAEDVWNSVTKNLPSIKALIYSTHSFTPKKPSLRFVSPLNRIVTPEEYEPIARYIAYRIGIDWMDHTTYQVERLFFWASSPKDAETYFNVQEGRELNADAILGNYNDWRDVSQWYFGKDEVHTDRRTSSEPLQDPREKSNVIGAFCRAYTIEEAIELFLPDVYSKGSIADHYTYTKGSTANGLAVYNHLFAYSHHNSDPANDGHTHNAFDLVRIHKFGYADEGRQFKKIDKAPSFGLMQDFALSKKECYDELTKDMKVLEDLDFSAEVSSEDNEKEDWLDTFRRLSLSKNKSLYQMLILILENDTNLANHIWLDAFSQTPMADKELPWRKDLGEESESPWVNSDDANLRYYIDRIYHIRSKEVLRDALEVVLNRHKRDPLKEYLNSLNWDGAPRLDTILIDYLGADDTELNRAMTRKHLVGAIKRVYEPACKYDYCLALTGGEGIGKTRFVKTLAGKWFSNSLFTFEGKEGMEAVQGAWMIELGELAAVKRSESELIKLFLTKEEDKFRPAFKERTEYYRRRCVFFATTNDKYFLKGSDGNRRFWVVPVAREKCKMYPDTDDAINALEKNRDQILAEAKARYLEGEKVYLTGKLADQAKAVQDAFNERIEDPLFFELDTFLEILLPKDWKDRTLAERKKWFKEWQEQDDPCSAIGTEPREFFCIKEFLVEFKEMDTTKRDYFSKAREVGKWMDQKRGWLPIGVTRQVEKVHGMQRTWRKVTTGSKSITSNLSQVVKPDTDSDDEIL